MPNLTVDSAPSVLALNWYFARSPDLAAEVLATRLRACEVREQLGVPAGRVLRRLSGEGDLPDVIWDCPFDSAAQHDADMAARAASADFEAVRANMRNLTRRFERVLYTLGERDPALLPASGDRQRTAQLWIHVDAQGIESAARTSRGSGIPLYARKRIGDAKALPDWIIEVPAGEALPPVQLAPGLESVVMRSQWERIR